MDEILEAEVFSRELDALLAGKPVMPADSELGRDLAFAARLAAVDLSGESQVKKPLKAGLLGAPRRWWRLSRGATAALAAGVACVLLVPAALYYISAPESYRPPPPVELGHSAFGGGASPYEPGISGLAPGGLGGSVSDVAGNEPASGLDYASPTAYAKKKAADQARAAEQAAEQAPIAPPSAGPELASDVKREAEGDFNTADYGHLVENSWEKVVDHPLSTFSIDVDGASYANVRRFLTRGQLPPADAVRVEELVNYFDYDYPEPADGRPLGVAVEQAACPWDSSHKLVRVAMKAKAPKAADLPPSNLVFLLDTSGSMLPAERLPLLKKAFSLLVRNLREKDRVSIVAYAGAAGLVLPPTPGSRRDDILAALDRLQAGGSTAGGAGIELAYKVARESFLEGGNNRVILATDGDFNVGLSSQGDLIRLIEEKRKTGVFLTTIGVGDDNLKDATMKALADHGDGNYYYLDDIGEAQRIFGEKLTSTLYAVAKDVKFQVEFNPSRVQAYRLIGYESRLLKSEDFNDDKKDAGELGAGHAVTALYELIPAGARAALPAVDELRYQKLGPSAAAGSDELLTLKVRYKDRGSEKSKLLSLPLTGEARAWKKASDDFRFAAAVAGFGMMLRHSEFKGDLTYAAARKLAAGALVGDEKGYRGELLRLIDKADALDERGAKR